MTDPTRAFLNSRDFARIARAIRFIEEHFREQPRLAQIAQAAHLSEFHFNRLFRRWAGVTPRQYLAFVTARAARRALTRAPSVLEAAYEVGLSGPGRLHDLMVTLEAVTPGEYRSSGAGLKLRSGFTDTPFGRALIASTARGIAHLSFLEPGGESQALGRLSAQWPCAAFLRQDSSAAAVAAQIWDPRSPAAGCAAARGERHELSAEGVAGTARAGTRGHDDICAARRPHRGARRGPCGRQRRGGESGGVAHSLS